MPLELLYQVQSDIVRQSINEEIWDCLNCDTRRYLLNLSHHIDSFFMYETIPPDAKNVCWTNGEKQLFVALFHQWCKAGVDPRKYWSLFSLNFPSKTGNQCRNHYNRSEELAYMRIPEVQDNPAVVREYHLNGFRFVCQTLIPGSPQQVARVNDVANTTACQEMALEYETDPAFPTQASSFEDKVTYIEYPGTGFYVGQTQCYAAVILQFLARIDEVVDLVSVQLIARKSEFLKLLMDLRYKIEVPGRLISIEKIVERSNLSCDEQQDVHEFFLLVVGKLMEEFEDEYANLFSELFAMTIQNKNEEMRRCETFFNLDICLDGTGDLETLVLRELQDCEIVAASRLLVIYVVRTEVCTTAAHFRVNKNMGKVAWKEQMDLTANGAGVYSLIGIIYHEGWLTDCGHYFALFFEGSTIVMVDGQNCVFVSCDDVDVKERIAQAQEVMFFYGSNIHLRCWFRVAQLVAVVEPEVDSNLLQRDSERESGWVVHPKPARQRTTTVFRGHEAFYSALVRAVQEERAVRKPRHMTLGEKLLVAAYAGGGISPAAISSTVQRHRSTITRFLEEPLGVEAEQRSNLLQDVELIKTVLSETMKGQRLSSSRLAAKISQVHGVLLSKETVRQLRRKAGLRFLAPIPKSKLTISAKNNRVVFAVDWITNRLNLLRRTPIIFSDESTFIVCENGRKLWRIPGECLESDYVQLEQHPCQIMVWGAIGVGYKSPLLLFDGTCTKERYISMLDENGIILDLNELFGERQFVFQQDNAPPHVAKLTLNWLTERVNLLTSWPPHSPDLSPVEMMWALAKSRIDTTDVTTKEELFRRVCSVWDDIPQSFVDNMASSFEARLRAVIRLQGDTLNGHWLYVHRIHLLLQTVDVEDIDSAIQQLDEVSPRRYECGSDDVNSPFVEIAQLEDDFYRDVSGGEEEEEEEEATDKLLWEHDLGEEAVLEVVDMTSNRPSAWRRLVHTMQTTARFLWSLFSHHQDG